MPVPDFSMPLAALPFEVPSTGGWLALLASYLLGAVPFGWLLVRLLKGVDLRTVGSGNIGSTNAMRVLGKPLGILAFLLDFGKGWLPVAVLADALTGGTATMGLRVLCGAAAVAGHVWPIYLRFRGGKAVATGFGGVVAIDPLIFVGGGIVWLLVLVTTRYVSLASICMGLTFPILSGWRSGERYGWEVVLGTAALAVLILWRHRPNIGRLLAGTELRAGAGRGAETKVEDRA